MRTEPYPGDPRYLVREDGVIFGARGRPLKPIPGGPYLQVSIGHGNVRRIHVVVAETYLGPRPAGAEVDHIDNCKENNAASNLRYLTHPENMEARYEQVQACKRGHPFTEENTVWNKNASPRPRRRCRTCLQLWEKRRKRAL